jgi:hypothetical protein
MTREEIEQEYKVIAGIITSPGKFEGESVYAPHYWNLGLEGGADEDDGESYVFHLDSSDVLVWPELSSVRTLRLIEDDNGFVHTFRECRP